VLKEKLSRTQIPLCEHFPRLNALVHIGLPSLLSRHKLRLILSRSLGEGFFGLII
jgi:hypothetical protein